ncbi:MAG: outer membrane lipoprotein-sorting protein [candidate division Zixibacteria bacterium]|nr:outer membrane lipoprotein-sorting protein [candidate division Zixibacteria bacterium]
MEENKMRTIKLTLLVLGLTIIAFAYNADAKDASELMKKSHMAYYYAADDGLSEVNMRLINKRGKERVREFTMLRLDESDGGKQMYYTYFKSPSDVARMTFMVHKTPGGNDARWIYVPSVDLVKPISADDKNSSFVGSDFSYEDVSGRHWTEDNHKLLEESTLNGKEVYVIESVPKEDFNAFHKKLTYIDKETLLPMKEEYFDKDGEMTQIMRLEKVETVDGIPTATVRSMENLKKGSKTIVEFNSIDYNLGLKDNLFTERYLKNPPRKYIR